MSTDRADRAATEKALGELVEQGYVELVGVDEDGELHWRLTPAGIEHVEKDLLGPEATP